MRAAGTARWVGVALGGLALVMALSACSGASPQPATTPITIPKAAPAAAPGATVPLRSPVTVSVTNLRKQVPIGVAVLAAFSSDASYWDSIPNGSKYKGLTPVWVVTQYRWPSVQVTPQLALEPVTRDGSVAKPLVVQLIGGSPGCGIRLENEHDIKPTGMECELIAMQHPTALQAVEYRGSLLSDVVAPDPATVPYVRTPLRFAIPKGATPVPAAAAHPAD